MIKAYSKINIGLDIDKTEYDFTNKHKIESLFYLYKNLYDEVYIKENDLDNDVILYFNKVIDQKDCLIRKTLNYLRYKNITNKFYDVKIIKNIPIKSGLGGASSDAAVIIKHICKDIKQLDMLEISLLLGSDICFFLYEYDFAIVKEFGNVVIPISLKTNLNIKIIFSEYKFSTKKVFEHFLLNEKYINKKNDFNKIINELNSNNYNLSAINNLYGSVSYLNGKWDEFYKSLKTSNNFIIMSGSGGTIVMIDKEKKVRTRYAPSPTGYFHIGGARTAIFNYLFAKHNNGDFVVRIEDTDMDRSVENGIESQLNNLEWLNITPDESIRNPKQYGPYIQSEKLDRYRNLVNTLLKENKAYYCFCNENKLEENREKAIKNHQTPKYDRHCLNLSEEEKKELLNKNVARVVRLKIDENQNYEWNDLIRGIISVPGSAMTDPVILKSNGIAMYNFAVVVDDYDMEISHVLRGEEHISNTPYQLAIKNALQFNNDIKYGHLSVIIDETGKKLSKRNKEMKQFIEDYKIMGFLPDAVFNFLSLLSWSSPTNQEIIFHEDLIKEFSIDRLSKSPTFFDIKKMMWIGNEYFKKISDEQYLNFVKKFITIELSEFLQKNIDVLLLMFKNQISYASELNQLISDLFIYNTMILSDELLHIVNDNLDVAKTFKQEIEKIKNWNIDEISNAINNVKNTTSKKGKDLFMTIRIISTNKMHGPELTKALYFTQQERILSNIDKIIK